MELQVLSNELRVTEFGTTVNIIQISDIVKITPDTRDNLTKINYKALHVNRVQDLDYTEITSPVFNNNDELYNWCVANLSTVNIPNTTRGFDRLNPDTMGVPSYNTATRTFTLSVKDGQDYFHFWSDGTHYIETSAISEVWPDETGTYYFYLDGNGDMQCVINTSVSESVFTKSAICGLVYWNATTGEAIVQAKDEQHGIIMDASTHFNLHLTRGFKWAQGGLITGLADGSDVYTNIEVGLHFDEDIPNVNTLITSTPFMWREGADGAWVQSAADLKIGHVVSGDTYISYNEFTGGAWQLTESTNSTDYIIYMIAKTNDVNHPYKKVVGQQTYPNRNAAREGLLNELNAICLCGLPSTESEFQFAWIARRNGDLEDDGNGNAYVDLRGITIGILQ